MKAHTVNKDCNCEVCVEARRDVAAFTRELDEQLAISGLPYARLLGVKPGQVIPVKSPEEYLGTTFTGFDPVNRPAHYNSHPSGVECITITQHYNFCLGNVIKYLWRSDLKNSPIEDLKKARWYLDREISNREKSVS